MLSSLTTTTIIAQMAITPLPDATQASDFLTLKNGTSINAFHIPTLDDGRSDLHEIAVLDLSSDLNTPHTWNKRFRTSLVSTQDSSESNPESTDAPAINETASRIAFGTQGQLRWTIQGAWSISVKDAEDQSGLLGFGIDYFLIDNLSINGEFNGAYVNQVGPDAWGFNFNLIARWHIIAQENWSFFVDGGAGLLWTTENVPDNGSRFNFTPQAGVGCTIGVGGNARVITGVRWLHISNANLYSSNPGRDSIEVYAGITLPF
ncbi:MAG: acyloxyacyl hydrolase [Phycisphaerales bacterium]|nr:acyloxyacyl hydrolase [Phycisphaerales bacterium]